MRSLLIIALALTLSCKAGQSGAVAAQSQEGIENTSLEGRWILAELDGKSLTDLRFLDPPTLDLKMTEKRLGGNDGCNNFFGQLGELDEQRLTFEIMGSTKMVCPEVQDTNLLVRSLNNVKTFKINGDVLHLYDEAGKDIIQYKRTKE